MIYINIYKINNKIHNISIEGHSIEGKKGNNIVCAALSMLTKFLIIGLEDVSNFKIDVTAKEEGKINIRFNGDVFLNEQSKAVYLTFIKSLNWLNDIYINTFVINYIESEE